MSTPQWEEVEVPRGAYIGWGNLVGQHVTGRVIEFDLTGGTDFSGAVCPALTVELTEPAASFNKEGQRTDHPAGEMVILNCGQVSLRRAVRAMSPEPGDLVKITLSGLVRTANGTVKEMSAKIARGGGRRPQQQAQPQRFQPTPATQAAAQQFAQAQPLQQAALQPDPRSVTGADETPPF